MRLVDDWRIGRPYWAVTRHEDVTAVLADERTYSSRSGSPRLPRSGRRLTPEERHAQAVDVRVNHLDPPLHTVYRGPMNKHFSVPAVKRLDTMAREVVSEVLDEVPPEGGCS